MLKSVSKNEEKYDIYSSQKLTSRKLLINDKEENRGETWHIPPKLNKQK